MASLNSDNIIKNVSVEEKPAPAPKKPKKSGKNNNQVYILIGLILFCIVGGYFLFRGDASQNAGANLEQATAAADSNSSKIAPPPPPIKTATLEQNAPTAADMPAAQQQSAKSDQNDMFNQSAINEALNAPAPAPQQHNEQQEQQQEQEQSLGKWASAPQQELQQRPLDAVAAQQQEQNIKSTFEARLESLKNNIVMKVNFFSYSGKNYYEGDKILDFKIKEVTKTKVTLQDVDKKLITLNFGSK